MLPSPKLLALLSLACAAAVLSTPATAENCEELWYARNAIFAEAGHCFKTPRAVATFGPRCYAPYGRLQRSQEARVKAIAAQERRQGCSGEPSSQPAPQPEAQLPPPPPPPPAQDSGADKRLSEAAAVWTATKDTTSPAVLEAFISRFSDTPFADLARARLGEVKKPVDSTSPSPSKSASKEPPPETSGQEMCPKYIPSVGRTVQAPCES